MNLLSDLSSELAIAILVDKKHAEKFGSTDAASLIGKVFEILEPISKETETKQSLAKNKERKIVGH